MGGIDEETKRIGDGFGIVGSIYYIGVDTNHPVAVGGWSHNLLASAAAS